MDSNSSGLISYNYAFSNNTCKQERNKWLKQSSVACITRRTTCAYAIRINTQRCGSVICSSLYLSISRFPTYNSVFSALGLISPFRVIGRPTCWSWLLELTGFGFDVWCSSAATVGALVKPAAGDPWKSDVSGFPDMDLNLSSVNIQESHFQKSKSSSRESEDQKEIQIMCATFYI